MVRSQIPGCADGTQGFVYMGLSGSSEGVAINLGGECRYYSFENGSPTTASVVDLHVYTLGSPQDEPTTRKTNDSPFQIPSGRAIRDRRACESLQAMKAAILHTRNAGECDGAPSIPMSGTITVTFIRS